MKIRHSLAAAPGDHVIERFRLTPRGASFASKAETIVRGGDHFRPVGIAAAPDGSLYLSDWVDQEYPVHGKGRIWRIRMKEPPADDGLRVSKVAALAPEELRQLLRHPRVEIRSAAAAALTGNLRATRDVLAKTLQGETAIRARLHALWTAARLDPRIGRSLIAQAMSDPAPEVRAEAIRLQGTTHSSSSAPPTDETRLVDLAVNDPSALVRFQAIDQLRDASSLKVVVPILADPDPFLVRVAIAALGRPGNSSLLLPLVDASNPRLRLGVLLALRQTEDAAARAALPRFLADPDPGVRRAAIQWVGEERLQEFAAHLSASAARPPVTRELFEALLAANDFLSGVQRQPSDEPSGEQFIAKVLQDPGQPSVFRAMALRMLRPDHPAIRTLDLRQFLAGPDEALRREAVRTLIMRGDDESQELLRKLAGNSDAKTTLRAQAILGLAHSAAGSPVTRNVLLSFLNEPALQRDALRSLRGVAKDPDVQHALLTWWEKKVGNTTKLTKEQSELAAQLIQATRPNPNPMLTLQAGPSPPAEDSWRTYLAQGGDPEAGERVFFHAHGPRCFACHRVDGRGAAIGPDLSSVGRALSRAKLIESILAPSKEIAPQFTSWLVATRDGKVRTGLIVEEGPNSTITIADAQGKLEVINRVEVEERHAVRSSIMPDNLHQAMTLQEFQDLIAFLCARK